MVRSIATVLVLPVACPAWGLEWLIRRRRAFEFGLISSIPYLASMALLGTALVVAAGAVGAWVGFALLASMEIVALGVALVIGLGDETRFARFVADVARRRIHTGSRAKVWYAVTAAGFALCYSIWFFACAAVVLHRFVDGQLAGVASSADHWAVFWQCLYYSSMTIVTGSSTVTPVGGWSQLASLVETAVGLMFFVFVVAVITDRHTSSIGPKP